MVSAMTLTVGSVQAARLLHQALLRNKMRSPQSFFDTTPSGRILNRFSKDIYVIDEVLAPTILLLLTSFYNSISALVVVVVSTPLFAVVTLPLAAFYILVQVRRHRRGGVPLCGRGPPGAGRRCGRGARVGGAGTQGTSSWIWLGTGPWWVTLLL